MPFEHRQELGVDQHDLRPGVVDRVEHLLRVTGARSPSAARRPSSARRRSIRGSGGCPSPSPRPCRRARCPALRARSPAGRCARAACGSRSASLAVDDLLVRRMHQRLDQQLLDEQRIVVVVCRCACAAALVCHDAAPLGCCEPGYSAAVSPYAAICTWNFSTSWLRITMSCFLPSRSFTWSCSSASARKPRPSNDGDRAALIDGHLRRHLLDAHARARWRSTPASASGRAPCRASTPRRSRASRRHGATTTARRGRWSRSRPRRRP